jgi:4-methyl-5(b-hydroxyethyl)-thiazole monophosphate biosynthesis
MKKVLLLLADGFEIYEASAFIDVIGWNLVDGDGSTELFTCGLKKNLISTFNQRFTVDFLINEIDPKHFDALAIPGGFEEYGFYNDAYNADFLKLINKFNAQNKPIASICVGSLPLGKSGILANKNATTFQSLARTSALESTGAIVINEPIVITGNIITSWNPGTAVDVAFLLLEKLTGMDNANKVRSLMGFS